MRLSEKQRKFSLMVSEFIVWIYQQGYEVTLGEALRPPEMQKLYMEKGLTKTPNSKHLDKLAIDLNLFKGGKYTADGADYRPLGEKWESLGGTWGGRFGVRPAEYAVRVGWDANHFEFKE